MSSLALMRWLESTPAHYDAGMRCITLGRIERLHAALVEGATPGSGSRVLEIGCGTGAVTLRLARRGAEITALDHDPAMLERARARLAQEPGGRVSWLEQTAAEIDRLPAAAFDAVVASLCLSEMSADERRFVLAEARRCLRPGGVLVVADEVRPRLRWQRLLFGLLRGPQAALGWLLAGSLSHPIGDLAGELRQAGLQVRREARFLLGSLAVMVAADPS